MPDHEYTVPSMPEYEDPRSRTLDNAGLPAYEIWDAPEADPIDHGVTATDDAAQPQNVRRRSAAGPRRRGRSIPELSDSELDPNWPQSMRKTPEEIAAMAPDDSRALRVVRVLAGLGADKGLVRKADGDERRLAALRRAHEDRRPRGRMSL